MDDLHSLPKIRDRLSYLYVEHARVDRHEKSIAIWDQNGYSPVPVAALAVLMLGPGTALTHAAVQVLAENACLVVWCGEENVRFYAFGTGGTRSAAPLLLQARLASDEKSRLEVVRRMYRLRFGEDAFLDKGETVESLRGREGFRVREAYKALAGQYGVHWSGRNYDRGNWSAADPVNRALSCANSCLYGLCHAAIVATGYSPGIGFIHTGKQLSFVYDIADLYKVEVTIPVAFRAAAVAVAGTSVVGADLERTVRLACRDRFRETKLLARIVPDIQRLFGVRPEEAEAATEDFFTPDVDPAMPTDLWTPEEERAARPERGTNTIAAAADVAADADAAPSLLPLPPAPAAPASPPPLTVPPRPDGRRVPPLRELLADPSAVVFGPDPGCETPPRPPRRTGTPAPPTSSSLPASPSPSSPSIPPIATAGIEEAEG